MKSKTAIAIPLLAALVLSAPSLAAAPVELKWKPAGETNLVAAARQFCGFAVPGEAGLPAGTFAAAGGTLHDGKVKSCVRGVYLRSPAGVWTPAGELPAFAAAAEGASVSTPRGIFCAGGISKDGGPASAAAFLMRFGRGEGGSARAVFERLPDLPEPVSMCAAAATGEKVYLVASKKIYGIDLAAKDRKWTVAGEIPGPAREQHVAAVQNGDQKEKRLIVFGGFDKATRMPLPDGHAMVLASGEWKRLSPLPEGITSIGAAFLPSGDQHILLLGGFGRDGWIARAVEKSKEKNPTKLGWNRKAFAYNAVTDAWCEYGGIAAGDKPRCGAAAGLLPGKTAGEYLLVVAGGETAPAERTAAVSSAVFERKAKFGAKAWIVVGAYALLMAGMACFFIFKKKDENDYFRGGNRIPWYVAGMSIFATMLSSITFIAIPTQAYLSDWRYFPMAICIFAIAPVAIYYYLPFFCRLGITSAYEYLEKRFNLGVRLFGSAAFVIFMVCRVAVVTLLPAIALNAVTGVSIDVCILVCGVLTMVYCSLGGLEAVIWSDFIQGIVLLGGALSVLIILICKTGPEGAHLSAFWSLAEQDGKNTMWDLRWILSQPVLWVVLVQGVVSNLSSYTSDQCVIQRYIATPDENATKRSIWFNGAMSVFASVIFYGIGTALYTHYKTNPAMMDVTMPKSDSVFPVFMAVELPWWLAGLVIAAIFAATISTLSANLSSASTAVVTDFVKRFRPGISGRAQIRCGQACTYAVGVVGIAAALALARMESRALFDNFQEFIAMLTAGLTGLFFMGVFMPRVKGGAAVAGLSANYIVCFACKALDCTIGGFKFHPFLLGGIGLAVCVAVAFVCSFFLKGDGRSLEGLTLKSPPRGAARKSGGADA